MTAEERDRIADAVTDTLAVLVEGYGQRVLESARRRQLTPAFDAGSVRKVLVKMLPAEVPDARDPQA